MESLSPSEILSLIIYLGVVLTGYVSVYIKFTFLPKIRLNKLKQNEIPPVHFARQKKTSSANTRNKYEIKT